MKYIILIIGLLTQNCLALDLFLDQGSHLGGYSESFYVKDNLGLYVRTIYEEPKTARVKELIPIWNQIEIDDEKFSKLKQLIIDSNIKDWDSLYPQDRKGFICDGLGVYLAIDLNGKKQVISAECEFPKEYEKFVNGLRHLFNIEWAPNK